MPFSKEVALLSSVFYGVSKEGNMLVTATIGLRQIFELAHPIDDKFRLFNMYGAEDCIPTYDQLTLKRSHVILCCRLHDDHGVSAFSAPSSDGMSIFQKAFLEGDKRMVDTIERFAKEHESMLAVEWISQTQEGKTCNLLKEALNSKSATRVKDAVEVVNLPVVPFRNAAKIMKESFKDLVANDLSVIEHALANNLLVTKMCELNVHAKFMDPKRRVNTADHIGTSDTILDWKHIKDETALEENWKRKNADTIKDMQSHGNDSKTRAALKFVRIEDAAKTGMNGIIRPLLLRKVPEKFFEFDVIKWVVMFKWLKIWRQRFRKSACWYAFFVAFFTGYTIYLSRMHNLEKQSTSHKLGLSSFLVVSFLFSGRAALDEVRQLRTYMRDSVHHSERDTNKEISFLRRKLKGLFYYLGFKWNWIDLLSYAMMIVCITPLHIISLYYTEAEDSLSAFVAIECVVLYAKVWYYAQPFQFSGPLVQMIGNIVWDCWAFLFLAVIVMLGYAIALPVLFRHLEAPADSCPTTYHHGELAVMNCLDISVTNTSNELQIRGQHCVIEIHNGCSSGTTYCKDINITETRPDDTSTQLNITGEHCLVSNRRTSLEDVVSCHVRYSVEDGGVKDTKLNQTSHESSDTKNKIVGQICTSESGSETLLGINSCEGLFVSTSCETCDSGRIEITGQSCTGRETNSSFLQEVSSGKKSIVKHDSHRHVYRSLLTLFYAVLGNFDPTLYLSNGELSWLTTIMFVSYQIVTMIVLLNLLISLMSDTFDRVKATEEAQLLMGRAQFIDACEATLSDAQCDEIDQKIGKYLHVLVNPDERADTETSLWMGRIGKIKNDVRRIIQNSQSSVMKRMDGVEQQFLEMAVDLKYIKELLASHGEEKQHRYAPGHERESRETPSTSTEAPRH